MTPTKTAAYAGHDAQPAVIDTSPVSTPLHMHATSHCLPGPRTRSSTTAVMPPHEAEMVVVAKTRAAVAVARPVIASVEPALKPYHPIHRMNVPSAWSTLECPGIGSGLSLARGHLFGES